MSGSAIFGVPSSGTWEVEVTREEKVARRVIEITDRSIVTVAIEFAPDWYAQLRTQQVGDTTTIDGIEWIVVNKTEDAAVLGSVKIYKRVIFGLSTEYDGSTLAATAKAFENEVLSDTTKELLNQVTIRNVTAMCFVPTREQFNGGFSYYNNDAKRVCYYGSSPDYYWTSSDYNGFQIYDITTIGVIRNNDGAPSNTRGFRPHIEVNMTF